MQIVNSLKDALAPDVMPFVRVNTEEIEEKRIIEINVTTGTNRPYYLREKGLKPSGVYVRKGSSTQPMTEEGIREMIIQNSGRSFELCRSMKQELTFQTLQEEMKKRSIELGISQMRTLKMIGEDGLYTNLALLLSDQCEITTKVALFQGLDKEVFRDRKEFTGSILKQLEDQSRNPNLAAVFYLMTLIESYGTGIGKIQRAYKNESKQPEFETAKGVFRVTLPNRNELEEKLTEPKICDDLAERKSLVQQKQKIVDYARENGKITRKEVEELLHAGSTKAFRLLKELCEEGWLESYGNGKLSCYVLKS